MTCPHCLNSGWVCESHFGRPWEGLGACGCGDSGVACSCNLEPERDTRTIDMFGDGDAKT